MRGRSAGAKAANQASVLEGSVAVPSQPCGAPSSEDASPDAASPPPHCVFSSAVPVLPATTMPGIAAAGPGAARPTLVISRPTGRAALGAITVAPLARAPAALLFRLGGASLAGDDDAGNRRGGSGAVAHAARHQPPDGARALRVDHVRPVRARRRRREGGPGAAPAVADRGGDDGHLQR